MKIYIYAIYFPISNKYYVGTTNNIKIRMYAHLRSKHLIGNALRKHDDWLIEILHITKDRDVANLLEIEEIRHYNSITPNGYNLTAGGDGLFNPSKEIRNKMSYSMKGNKNGIGRRSKEFCNEMRILNIGNQNAKGKLNLSVSKMMKENNPMKNEVSKLKWKISRLKNFIDKLERAI